MNKEIFHKRSQALTKSFDGFWKRFLHFQQYFATNPFVFEKKAKEKTKRARQWSNKKRKKMKKLFIHAVCYEVPCKASKTCLAGLLLLFRTRFFLLESPEGFGCPVFRFFLFNTDRGLTSSGCFRFRCGFVSWFVEFLNSLRIFFSCLLGSRRDFSTLLDTVLETADGFSSRSVPRWM